MPDAARLDEIMRKAAGLDEPRPIPDSIKDYASKLVDEFLARERCLKEASPATQSVRTMEVISRFLAG